MSDYSFKSVYEKDGLNIVVQIRYDHVAESFKDLIT